ncbi:MAG: hypothetical protein KDJ52_19910 [Anaerolineae bacterium]|nr:hypothetical protein [Anaerolineae bacterium]
MMNKAEILQLNVIPEGKAAWLSYEQYLELKRLFGAVPLPSAEETTDNFDYMALHRFLTEVAGLELALDEAAVHFNAFALIRRGYQVEAITLEEYEQLRRLTDGLEQPDSDDFDLYDTGGHRALYDYLTRRMGLPVQVGRGPAWYRAKALIDKYEG